MNERKQWQKEVRAKHAERKLPPPVLEGFRPLSVNASRIPASPPHPGRLLRVETGYFVAGALWEKIGGVWSCTHAAPILRWMKGRSPQQAAAALEKMGADYQFLESSKAKRTELDPAGATVATAGERTRPG